MLTLFVLMLAHVRASDHSYKISHTCLIYARYPLASDSGSNVATCARDNDTLPPVDRPRVARPFSLVRHKLDSLKGNLLFRSTLTKYNGERGENTGFVYSRNWAKLDPAIQHNVGIVQLVEASVGELYHMAYADTIGTAVFTRYITGIDYPDTLKHPFTTDHYGKYWRWNIMQVQDSSPFAPNFKTFDNLYNYSLIVPDCNGSAKFLQKAMQNDLANYFGYRAEVKDTLMPYLALQCREPCNLHAKNAKQPFTSTKMSEGFRYSSALMKDILVRFLVYFSQPGASYDFQPFTMAPFIDETGISGKIDYDITDKENDAMQKGDWNMALVFLDRLGLKLVLRQRVTRVVVVSDPD